MSRARSVSLLPYIILPPFVKTEKGASSMAPSLTFVCLRHSSPCFSARTTTTSGADKGEASTGFDAVFQAISACGFRRRFGHKGKYVAGRDEKTNAANKTLGGRAHRYQGVVAAVLSAAATGTNDGNGIILTSSGHAIAPDIPRRTHNVSQPARPICPDSGSKSCTT